MNSQKINVPVFQNQEECSELAQLEPSSLSKKLTQKALTQISNVEVDNESLSECYNQIEKLIQQTKYHFKENPSINIDTLKIKIGISSNGKIALLGSSVGVKVVSEFEITLKIDN